MFGNKTKQVRPTADIDTLIGAGTSIRGDMSFSGGLRIDGQVVGIILAEGADAMLVLADKGRIEGEIRAPHVIINGLFKGEIFASERVELAAQARVTGNIHYKILEMAAGAQVTGQILREGEPRAVPVAAEPPLVLAAEISAEAQLEARVDSKAQSKLSARRA
ncbi:MAG: cell shape determination protein CcmA [Lysobacterales bacterium CG02_land_8_20_14_3_00_62_12]|nr:MAG: cell shape determination protein CcmA [Xanthomonadales bacterium CG02_land_8_20_14_3_00_62_12]PJA41941.1 MAG: cell shape determination protein CcmA [Xanthomonadales bacterium CG_4_9_14_3_um_filter_62_6]